MTDVILLLATAVLFTSYFALAGLVLHLFGADDEVIIDYTDLPYDL